MRNYFTLVAVLLFGSSACYPQTTTGRYLYVVGCGAQVDKLDTSAERKSDVYDLTQRTGRRQLIPSVKGALDGCLAYQAAYDSAVSIFYTVVPVEAEPKPGGKKDYRVLGFSVPDLQLVKEMPGGENLDDPPHLEIGKGERVEVLKAGEWSPRTDMDLSPYAPDEKQIPNQILEISGERVLLRIFTASQSELVLAVADRKSNTLVRLEGISTTVVSNVHLAPGGADVLIEEMEKDGGSRLAKNGKVALYDSKTGKRVKDFSDPHIKDLYFLAISPTGKAIYHSGETYWFIDIGRKFVPDAVTRPISAGYPGLFFADK